MENIFKESYASVFEGAKFHINLTSKTLNIGSDVPIMNGEYDGELGVDNMSHEDAVELIESLYDKYSNSVPSKMSEKARHTIFIAKGFDELSDEDLMYGSTREPARFNLEYTVLALILNGSLKWENLSTDGNQWFWQSENYRNFILLKDWFN